MVSHNPVHFFCYTKFSVHMCIAKVKQIELALEPEAISLSITHGLYAYICGTRLNSFTDLPLHPHSQSKRQLLTMATITRRMYHHKSYFMQQSKQGNKLVTRVLWQMSYHWPRNQEKCPQKTQMVVSALKRSQLICSHVLKKHRPNFFVLLSHCIRFINVPKVFVFFFRHA